MIDERIPRGVPMITPEGRHVTEVEFLQPKEIYDQRYNDEPYTGNHSGIMIHYLGGKEVRRTSGHPYKVKE